MSSQITETVNHIRKDAEKGISIQKLRVKYISFRDSYPKLFEAAADSSFPLTFLDPMIVQLKALNNKEIDLESADKLVYGKLQKQYVDPVLSN